MTTYYPANQDYSANQVLNCELVNSCELITSPNPTPTFYVDKLTKTSCPTIPTTNRRIRNYTSKDYNSRGIKKKEAATSIKNKEDIEAFKNYFLSQGKYRDYCLFVFGINTGRRCGDILSLNIENVVTPDGFIVDEVKLTEQKTKKTIIFPLNTSCKQALALYLNTKSDKELQPHQPLFYSRKKNKNGEHRIHRDTYYSILQNAAQHLSLSEDVHIGTHSMRQTLGYQFFKKTRNIEMLQKLFNHSSSFQTLTYIGVTNDVINSSLCELNL